VTALCWEVTLLRRLTTPRPLQAQQVVPSEQWWGYRSMSSWRFLGRSLLIRHLPDVPTRGADNLPTVKEGRAVLSDKLAAGAVDDVAAAEKEMRSGMNVTAGRRDRKRGEQKEPPRQVRVIAMLGRGVTPDWRMGTTGTCATTSSSTTSALVTPGKPRRPFHSSKGVGK